MCFWKCTKMFFVNFQMCQNVIPMYKNVNPMFSKCTFLHIRIRGCFKCAKMFCDVLLFIFHVPFCYYLLSVSFYLVPAIIISTSLPFITSHRNGVDHISAHFGTARASKASLSVPSSIMPTSGPLCSEQGTTRRSFNS